MKEEKPNSKPAKDTVYVDLDDEITSIIDKVENAKEKIVALVLPKRASVLQSIVNMRLLKRASENADKNVVLITNDSVVLPLAGAAGLHVAKNLQSKPHIPPSPVPLHESDTQPMTDDPIDTEDEDIDVSQAKIDYNRSIGELAAGHEVDEPETIPLDEGEEAERSGDGKTAAKEKTPKDKRLKVPNFDKFRLLVGLGIAGLVALIVFIILATSVLPKGKITIKTTSLPVSADFNATADTSAKELDEANSVIPAVQQKKDQTATTAVNATGQQNNGTKATGTVSLKNCGSSNASIPAGTGISSGGLTFITQKSVSLTDGNFDGGGNCKASGSHVGSVDVTAQSAGSKYNIGPSSFSVAGFSNVTGSSSSSMSGGTDNIATILSQADVDGAKQKITAADSDTFTKEFKQSLQDQGLYVIESTFKLGDSQTSSSVAVGTPAANANVTVKITHTVLTVKKEDLQKMVSTQLAKQIDASKQKLSDDDVLKGLSVTVQNQDSATKTTLKLTEATTAVPIIDVENVKKTATGKKTAEIRETLSTLPGVKEVQVKLSPFWVSKAPKASKITVIQEQVSESGNTSP